MFNGKLCIFIESMFFLGNCAFYKNYMKISTIVPKGFHNAPKMDPKMCPKRLPDLKTHDVSKPQIFIV